MSCELYIGNFPSSLTSEDLIVLFQDFDGIEFLRLIKKDKKCFAFFKCVDHNQVDHVVMTMNGIDVCGRNLIVRSSDQKVQSKIASGSHNSHQIEKQMAQLSLSPPRRGTQIAGSEHSYPNYHSGSQNSSQKPYSTSKPFSRGAKAKQNSFNYPERSYENHDYSIGYYDEKLERGADLKNDYSGYGSSKDFKSPYQNVPDKDPEISKDELFFVSVVNFPLGTPNKELYDLFSDYNPFKIFMICNNPRQDKQPTEAIVSFICQADATDAIINLDNTVYRKRVLLVTDAADTSIVPELLNLS